MTPKSRRGSGDRGKTTPHTASQRDETERGRVAERDSKRSFLSPQGKSRPQKPELRQAADAPKNRGPQARGARVGPEEDEDEEVATDDEDSDDDERDQLEERLHNEDWGREGAHGLPLVGMRLDPAASRAPHLVSTAPRVPYQLAIPTHGRWKPVGEMSGRVRFKGDRTPFILKHTLGFLTRQGIPTGVVTLFVATEEERQNYRRALAKSEWAGVKIVLSALGNRNNRNFIFKYYPARTYVVSIDDDVELIAWKPGEGITHTCLKTLPNGRFELLIFDAYQRMVDKQAFLWGLNTSQNPRHMKHYGVSVKNGLVNGYLNGFITRPECGKELLRTLADAMEDSEFAVRNYHKDGVVLRYRMYAGITRPYLNRGGLQEKFEASGEKITAADRSEVRKKEERWGALELHHLFPNLVGKPRARRDYKTMEVTFFPNGYPIGEGNKRRMICPRLLDEDQIRYAPNPKIKGTYSWKLYESYGDAVNVADARSKGARAIDFAFDSNWGYLQVEKLKTTPVCNECVITKAGERQAVPVKQVPLLGENGVVRLRVREMSIGHKGMQIAAADIRLMSSKCPSLRACCAEDFRSLEGPFSEVPLALVRVLFHWAATGSLVYSRRQTHMLHSALKRCGASDAASAVKQLDRKMVQAGAAPVENKEPTKGPACAQAERIAKRRAELDAADQTGAELQLAPLVRRGPSVGREKKTRWGGKVKRQGVTAVCSPRAQAAQKRKAQAASVQFGAKRGPGRPRLDAAVASSSPARAARGTAGTPGRVSAGKPPLGKQGAKAAAARGSGAAAKAAAGATLRRGGGGAKFGQPRKFGKARRAQRERQK